jgi:hypothetical protein
VAKFKDLCKKTADEQTTLYFDVHCKNNLVESIEAFNCVALLRALQAQSTTNRFDEDICFLPHTGLPDFSLYDMPKWEKYTKHYKLFRMAVTNISITRLSQILIFGMKIKHHLATLSTRRNYRSGGGGMSKKGSRELMEECCQSSFLRRVQAETLNLCRLCLGANNIKGVKLSLMLDHPSGLPDFSW